MPMGWKTYHRTWYIFSVVHVHVTVVPFRVCPKLTAEAHGIGPAPSAQG